MKDNYRFDTFIEAPSNIFALKACIGAADEPGELFNPIWVNGPSGCGKTHLLKALCASAADKGKEAVYMTSEDAGQALIALLHDASFPWSRIEDAELLVIDNIDFFLGKETTQQAFAELIEMKYRKGDQVAIASELRPSRFPQLSSLFKDIESAVDAELLFPDKELRRAVIDEYLKANPFPITERAIKALAEYEFSISQLKGMLCKARFLNCHNGDCINYKWIKQKTTCLKEYRR
ncbi:MAG: ATP-binding protein [Clostridia bacterium]|nr:ATP-binding protein [Clostridia bacterium]